MQRRGSFRLRRREFLAAAGGSALGLGHGCATRKPRTGASTVEESELSEVSVAELRAGLESGRWTAKSLCQACLERIDAIDAAGPAVNSIIEVNPDALAIAEDLDRERRTGEVRGPLHGIPVVLKDNVATADGMQTTAGSLALEGAVAPRDSWVASRLRAGGALLIAKTNLSEWANFRSRRSTSGWSGRGGLTRNPYFIERNPCGSSSGSGVAVSAGIAPLAIGTETNGSIVCPSSVNGIVGIKPTVGLVSRAGIVPISHTQDTAGPMARSVADAAAALGLLTGRDALDEATASSEGRSHLDYTRFLDPEALRGARIGLLREYWGRHAEVDAILDESVAAMRDAGAELVDVGPLPGLEATNEPGFEVMLFEFKAGLNRYLADLGPDAEVRSLDEVIRFNEEHQDREMPYFGQDILETAAAKGPLTDPAYLDALERSRDGARTAIDDTAGEHDLDAFFAPTTGPAWVTDLVHGDRSTFRGCSSAAARAGYPHVTVPSGSVFGLPVGVSFFGRAWSEPSLLALAYAFERATQGRRKPEFLPGDSSAGILNGGGASAAGTAT